MVDIFESKILKPMLIGNEKEPFNNPDYIYELKLDGERCIAFLDKNGTELRNKRSIKMLSKVPELSDIHHCIKKQCILDGELIVLKNGVPSFEDIKNRSLMSNVMKIELASKKLPATFVAYDILYYDGKLITDMPLMERKALLQKNIKTETERFSVSRYIEENGIALYELAKEKDLEGIVAKRKESKYYFGKRTKDWIKIKNLKDDEYVVCGYILKSDYITSLVLGQYKDNELIYMGHVTMGISKDDFKIIASQEELSTPPIDNLPKGHSNENATWITPNLVCTVKYMERTSSGGLRQPVFKGLRPDKEPTDCKVE